MPQSISKVVHLLTIKIKKNKKNKELWFWTKSNKLEWPLMVGMMAHPFAKPQLFVQITQLQPLHFIRKLIQISKERRNQ